jgi:hypothetical protein
VIEAATKVASFILGAIYRQNGLKWIRAMRLFLLPLLLVPFFMTAIVMVAVGAVLFRLLIAIGIAFIAAVFLFGRSVPCGVFRGCAPDSHQNFEQGRRRRFDERSSSDVRNSAFDDYRNQTLRRLEDEAREFRAFLAKLRQAADAADFQDFLKARRSGGPQNS